MSLQLRHCARCGALQADVAECGLCGAKLGGRARGDELGGREILNLATALIALFGGFVAVAIFILALIAWLL